MTVSPVLTEAVDLDTLCRKFPHNSRCPDNYAVNKPKIETSQHKFERSSFCAEFPFNSHCQNKPAEVIKLNMPRSGRDNEWIKIEKKDDTVRVVHTNQVEQSLVSDVIDGVMDLVDISVPFLFDTSLYKWEDSQVTQVSFKDDGCKQNKCIITGKETLKLPQGTNIYQGLFTIQYQEHDLMRSLSFRIPKGVEVETADTLTIAVPKSE